MLCALVLALALVTSSCTVPGSTPPTAVQQLETLQVVPRPARDPSYRRAAFGRAWADTDRDGCSQRVDALARAVDRSRPFQEVRRDRCRHDVVAGTWVDPYTGQPLTLTDLKDQRQAEQLPVDHVVALASAYRYGARGWTAERRLAFATDLDNLQPTHRATNAAKSDRDAADWRPKKPYQCAYATRYVQVKAEYALPVDRSEQQALEDMLATCPQ